MYVQYTVHVYNYSLLPMYIKYRYITNYTVYIYLGYCCVTGWLNDSCGINIGSPGLRKWHR